LASFSLARVDEDSVAPDRPLDTVTAAAAFVVGVRLLLLRPVLLVVVEAPSDTTKLPEIPSPRLLLARESPISAALVVVVVVEEESVDSSSDGEAVVSLFPTWLVRVAVMLVKSEIEGPVPPEGLVETAVFLAEW
jgi:hypothetical protein